jgi:hypothetical protein
VAVSAATSASPPVFAVGVCWSSGSVSLVLSSPGAGGWFVFSVAVDVALLPLPGGSFGADGSGSSSSMWSGMAASDCSFLYHRRSGSDRWVFIVLGTPWRARGVSSCGGSNVWSCAPAMAGGVLPGFSVRQFLGMV